MGTDELIFYGGLALAGVSLAAGLAGYVVFRIRYNRMQARFDEEYGPRIDKL